MQKQWSEVDNYLIDNLIPDDVVLSQVLENNHRAGLPAHDVAAVCADGGSKIHSRNRHPRCL